MKTDRDTPDSLILSETPWIMAAIASVLVLASIWAAMTGFGGGGRFALDPASDRPVLRRGPFCDA
jgi:hypothetical protein